MLGIYDRTDTKELSLDKVPQSRVSIGAKRPSDLTKTPSKKWHPLTYAIYYENLDLIKFLLSKIQCPLKKLLWVP